MDVEGCRVKVVASNQAVFAKPNVALEHEDLFTARMNVAWIARTGLELQQDGGRAVGEFVKTQDFDEDPADTRLGERLPLRRVDRSLAMETDKAGVSASGTVDFRSETLDLSFSPRLRQGIKIEALQVAQLVRLQGSFRDARVRLDAVASATSVARIGAAIGTGSLSVLGEALLHRSTQGGGGPCEVALGKALPESSNTAKSGPTGAPLESPARVLPRLRRH